MSDGPDSVMLEKDDDGYPMIGITIDRGWSRDHGMDLTLVAKKGVTGDMSLSRSKRREFLSQVSDDDEGHGDGDEGGDDDDDEEEDEDEDDNEDGDEGEEEEGN
jgi:hypothetical protein